MPCVSRWAPNCLSRMLPSVCSFLSLLFLPGSRFQEASGNRPVYPLVGGVPLLKTHPSVKSSKKPFLLLSNPWSTPLLTWLSHPDEVRARHGRLRGGGSSGPDLRAEGRGAWLFRSSVLVTSSKARSPVRSVLAPFGSRCLKGPREGGRS